MTTRKASILATAFCALVSLAAISRAQTTDAEDAAARAERWKALQEAIFGDRKVQDGSGVIELDVPPRALDAALVPVSLQLAGKKPIKGVYLVIDNNPSPLSAHFVFGPRADPRVLQVRVRVDEYTLMHAVAEGQDGKLYLAEKFVKAAGGCSAPAGFSEEQALQEMGRMKLRLIGDFAAGKPLQAQLMIRHPNFNGMQMNQITRFYTPARFIRSTEVTYDGSRIFHLDSDISMSTDPVIVFGFVPPARGTLKVAIQDSDDATFAHSFDVPQPPG
ncbi:MAG TPA: quinoprotein dehydrogenase-associated SoxYZ-like carrier [Steroidobacteraceae bacterium]|jgi:sulfur-oxidizing protein SoxY|nr:quinoprotein dehydrogenase-associated SoxYZ-like carrier [Steroidobacteraceae bacterium]